MMILLELALISLGEAYHAYSDSLSPAHEGFQPWWGPIDGERDLGFIRYGEYIKSHEAMETYDVYDEDSDVIVSAVKNKLGSDLEFILRQ